MANMLISARILRAEADDLPCRPRDLTSFELARQEKILDTATILLARHGTHAVTFRLLALAMRLSAATLRFHYVDLDALLGAILQRHLRALAECLAAVPHSPAETLHARRRAAWREATSAGLGTTPAHTLLLRDRHMLPPDLAETIDMSYRGLGAMLSPSGTPEALTLIDDPTADPARVEIMLAALAPPGPAVAAPDLSQLSDAELRAPRKFPLRPPLGPVQGGLPLARSRSRAPGPRRAT